MADNVAMLKGGNMTKLSQLCQGSLGMPAMTPRYVLVRRTPAHLWRGYGRDMAPYVRPGSYASEWAQSDCWEEVLLEARRRNMQIRATVAAEAKPLA